MRAQVLDAVRPCAMGRRNGRISIRTLLVQAQSRADMLRQPVHGIRNESRAQIVKIILTQAEQQAAVRLVVRLFECQR